MVVIDLLIDSVSDLDTHMFASTTPILLTAGQLVPITVMYYQNTGVAMVDLSWWSTSQTQQIIPATALYYLPQEKPITGNSFMINT